MWCYQELIGNLLETLGNEIGNIINNHLELGENMLGTIWNMMGTPKIVENPPTPPKGKKEGASWLTSLGAKNFLCVPWHFWSRMDNGKGHELWGHRLKEFGQA